MEDDLEEELLQVAGRSRTAGAKKRARADSDSEDVLDLSSDEDGGEGRRGRGGRKGSQPKGKKSRGRAASEDGDMSDGGGGSDDLYEDEEDRRRLEAMTELEREMILAERAEERDKARQRKELLQKTKGPSKADQKGPRQSSRQKQGKEGKDTAIRRIEAAREKQGKAQKVSGARSWSESEGEEELDLDDESADEREEGEEEGEERPTQRVTRSRAGGAAGDEDVQAAQRFMDEEEEEALRGVRRQTYDAADEEEVGGMGTSTGLRGPGDEVEAHAEDDENADAHELRAIQLTRTQLEAMCDKPFFEGEGLAGALVRMAYGPPSRDAEGNQVPTYWMMQIVSIKEHGSSYPFGPRGAPCFKRLELRDGAKVVRVLPMTTVSNQALEDAEIERFARHAGRVKDRPISKQQAAEIKQRVHDAINYRWDAAKVKEVLARKRGAGLMPYNIAAEKSRLKRMLEEAQSRQDDAAIAQYESQLAVLEGREKTKAAEQRNVSMSAINQRNKEANFNQTIRNVSNKPANAPERKGGADPFSRRVTRPNIYWNTTQNKPGAGEANGGAKHSGEAAEKETGAAAATTQLGLGGKLRGALARMDPTELVRMLDIDVDVTPLQDASVVPPVHLRLLGPRWYQGLSKYQQQDLRGKTLLSMADWQSRAGSMQE